MCFIQIRPNSIDKFNSAKLTIPKTDAPNWQNRVDCRIMRR